MNLIQALPPPSPQNTRFIESERDYDTVAQVQAIYDAGGPRFRVTESACFAELYAIHRLQFGGARSALFRAAVERLKLAMAEHLAIINPIDND